MTHVKTLIAMAACALLGACGGSSKTNNQHEGAVHLQVQSQAATSYGVSYEIKIFSLDANGNVVLPAVSSLSSTAASTDQTYATAVGTCAATGVNGANDSRAVIAVTKIDPSTDLISYPAPQIVDFACIANGDVRVDVTFVVNTTGTSGFGFVDVIAHLEFVSSDFSGKCECVDHFANGGTAPALICGAAVTSSAQSDRKNGGSHPIVDFHGVTGGVGPESSYSSLGPPASYNNTSGALTGAAGSVTNYDITLPAIPFGPFSYTNLVLATMGLNIQASGVNADGTPGCTGAGCCSPRSTPKYSSVAIACGDASTNPGSMTAIAANGTGSFLLLNSTQTLFGTGPTTHFTATTEALPTGSSLISACSNDCKSFDLLLQTTDSTGTHYTGVRWPDGTQTFNPLTDPSCFLPAPHLTK